MAISSNILKYLIIAITILAVIAMLFVAPIPQDQAFHHFADDRILGTIPNYWNVLTNLGFLWVGLLGLYKLHISKQLDVDLSFKVNYTIFFLGIALVALGSGYYHWQPNNHTLIWDRLPMTFAFMALLSIALGEFLSIKWGKQSLWPLLIAGLLSVSYWYVGELHGQGDLRPYTLVQYLPMVLLPLLFVFGKPIFNSLWGYWLLLLVYILAKILEYFDVPIFKLTNGLIAGHALKHLAVVIGLYFLLRYLATRKAKKNNG